ncbi:hypothetical protein [Bacillus sp. AFS015802]|uniref:hypothetical protein n=1 Tax=Bacillus sp. AFS015802 TaxID=2033486 RepID=UPI00115544C8|nr:hypothetical protein [Bacillus sp. AFS015802]
MKACALCNGIVEYKGLCKKCGDSTTDQGRYYDFYDEYSAYMDIQHVQLADSIPNSSCSDTCLHLFTCIRCGEEEGKSIGLTEF